MLREHLVISHPVHAAQVCTVLFAAAEQQEQSLLPQHKPLRNNQPSSIYSPNHQAGNGSAKESICQDGSQVSEEVPLAGEKKKRKTELYFANNLFQACTGTHSVHSNLDPAQTPQTGQAQGGQFSPVPDQQLIKH